MHLVVIGSRARQSFAWIIAQTEHIDLAQFGWTEKYENAVAQKVTLSFYQNRAEIKSIA